MLIFMALISFTLSSDFLFEPRLYLCQLFFTDNQKFFVDFLQKNLDQTQTEKELTRKALYVNVQILESCSNNLDTLNNTSIAEIFQSLSVGKQTDLETMMFFDLTSIDWNKNSLSQKGQNIIQHIQMINRMDEKQLKLEILKYLAQFAKQFSMLQFLEKLFIEMGFLKIILVVLAFGVLLYFALKVLRKSDSEQTILNKDKKKFDEAMQEIDEIVEKKNK